MHTVVWSIGQDGVSTVFTAIIITLKCLPGLAPALAVTSCSSKAREDPPQGDLTLATVCLPWVRLGVVGVLSLSPAVTQGWTFHPLQVWRSQITFLFISHNSALLIISRKPEGRFTKH